MYFYLNVCLRILMKLPVLASCCEVKQLEIIVSPIIALLLPVMTVVKRNVFFFIFNANLKVVCVKHRQ